MPFGWFSSLYIIVARIIMHSLIRCLSRFEFQVAHSNLITFWPFTLAGFISLSARNLKFKWRQKKNIEKNFMSGSLDFSGKISRNELILKNPIPREQKELETWKLYQMDRLIMLWAKGTHTQFDIWSGSEATAWKAFSCIFSDGSWLWWRNRFDMPVWHVRNFITINIYFFQISTFEFWLVLHLLSININLPSFSREPSKCWSK